MGLRGPAPSPLSILEKRGSWRAKLNPRSPKPPAGAPSCPDWIAPAARRVWRALVPILEPMAVLTKADRNALTRYCVTWARWRQAEEFIAENGSTFETEHGPKIRPEVRIAAQLSEQLGRMEQAFGLTPSARARVQANVSGEKKEDDLEARKRAMLRVGRTA